MPLRLPLGAALVALAALAFAAGVKNTPVPYAGLAIGVALALTVAYDALWHLRRQRSPWLSQWARRH